jgi:hypothetical protein
MYIYYACFYPDKRVLNENTGKPPGTETSSLDEKKPMIAVFAAAIFAKQHATKGRR